MDIPHDSQAEQALLGAAMLDDTGDIARKLDARLFYVSRHDKIARLIRTIAEHGKTPDAITVKSTLQDQGQLDAIGGWDFLVVCMQACPSSSNSPAWLQILTEKANARQVIRLCAKVEQVAAERPGEIGQVLDLLREGVKELEGSVETTSEAVPLMALKMPAPGDEDVILGHRYLCKKGVLPLAGPAGVGKSSFSLQFQICSALGRDLFGITPARPLRSILFQAENDKGDLVEMREGVLRGLGVAVEDREFLMSQILTVHENRRTGADFCHDVLSKHLRKHKPDVIWIDPVLSYLGGDTNAQAEVGAFLRNGIAPLLDEFNCAAVLVHHSNKPAVGRERPDWKAGDFAYLGSGSAEWANFPRAVLAIRSIGSNTEFDLVAGKRGARLGWVDANGQRTFHKRIQHAQGGGICWELAPEDDQEMTKTGRPKKADENDILALLPPDGLTTKDWRAKADEELGMSKTSFFRFKPILEAQGRVHHSKVTDKWQPVATRNGSGSTSPKSSPKSIMAQVVPKVPPPLGVGLFGTVSKAESNNGA